MSKQEAVLAYIKGSIGRREFIQRLTVVGVSSAAAVTYANALRPGSAAASGTSSTGALLRAFQDDDYGTATVTPTEVPTSPIEELLSIIAEVINALIDAFTELLDLLADILAALGITGAIADAAPNNFQQLIANLQSQLTTFGFARTPAALSGVLALQSTSSDTLETLSKLSQSLAGAYSYILQTTDDLGQVKTVGPIAIVAGRQAGYLLTLLAENPFPDASEPGVTEAELSDALDAAAVS